MILSFSKLKFVQKIFMGTKIHTIRSDSKNRWKIGMKIHAWYGSPRNPTKNPYQFTIMICCGIQQIEIDYQGLPQQGMTLPVIKIDGRYLSYHEKEKLAINDGFTTLDGFLKWFDKDFKGRIIHFTERNKY